MSASCKKNKAARHHMSRSLNRAFAVPTVWPAHADPVPVKLMPVYLICATIGNDGVHAVDSRGYSRRIMP